MSAGRAPSAQVPQNQDASAAAPQWYVVAAGGSSAVRIAPGLTVGESEAGALAFNDPDPAHQWIRFDLSGEGAPLMTVARRDKSLLVDEAVLVKHGLTAGSTLQLPHNVLHVSQDTQMPADAGPLVEVVPRRVPDRPEDLVGPGWEEALTAVRRGDLGVSGGAVSGGTGSEGAGQVEPAPVEQAPVAQPRHGEPGIGAAEEALGPRADPAGGISPAAGGYGHVPPTAWPAAGPREHIGGRAMTEARRPGRRRGRHRRRLGNLLLTASVALLAVVVGAAAAFYTMSRQDRAAAGDPTPLIEALGQRAKALERRLLPGSAADEGTPSAGAAASAEMPARAARTGSPKRPAANPVDPATSNLAPASASDSAPAALGGAAADETAGTPPAPSQDASADTTALAGASPGAERSAPATLPPAAGTASDGAAMTAPAPADEKAVASAPPARANAAGATPAAVPDWRLSRARKLLDDGYITFPPEDNAVAYLKRVLADDPDDVQARNMLEECSARLIEAATRAHDSSLDYEARNTLEEVFGFDPDNQQASRLWQRWVGSRH